MSTATATAYKTSAFRRPAFRASDRRKAQKSSDFRANGTYQACIKDCVLLDPCCGSGHILAYMFDVLMKIYESYGYTIREAVASIVENNISKQYFDFRWANDGSKPVL